MHISEIVDSDGRPLDAYIAHHLTNAVSELAEGTSDIIAAVVLHMEKNGVIPPGDFAYALGKVVDGKIEADPENSRNLGIQQMQLVVKALQSQSGSTPPEPTPKWKPTLIVGDGQD